MYSIRKKHLIIDLESIGVTDGKFSMKQGTISFESDEESSSPEYARITFNFNCINANTPTGVMCIDNLMVNLQTMKIWSWCKCIYDWVELGTMETFKTPEDAIRILEQFVDTIEAKDV